MSAMEDFTERLRLTSAAGRARALIRFALATLPADEDTAHERGMLAEAWSILDRATKSTAVVDGNPASGDRIDARVVDGRGAA